MRTKNSAYYIPDLVPSALHILTHIDNFVGKICIEI